jgi:hypothetical protein
LRRGRKQESGSFLKKRTKKLSFVANHQVVCVGTFPGTTDGIGWGLGGATADTAATAVAWSGDNEILTALSYLLSAPSAESTMDDSSG